MVNKNTPTAAFKQAMCLMYANACAGKELVGERGDTLGTVVDFVLDTGTGAVAYVVVASGGFMGIGEERYALPWACVTPPRGADGAPWHCAAPRLPPQYRLDSACPPAAADRPQGSAGTIAE